MNYKTPQQVAEEYKEKSLEKLEKDSKLNCIISGSACFLIGIVTIVSAFSSSTIYKARFGAQTIGTLFILLGVFFICRKGIEKIRRELLKDENSWLYKRKQSVLDKKQIRWRKKSVHHKSLKHEATRKFSIIAAVVTGVFFALTAIFCIGGEPPKEIFIIDVICVICFGLTFLGTGHKKLLRQYAEYGLDEKAAEDDVKSGVMYRKYAVVSRRFVTLLTPPTVIPLEKIVWVFPKVCYIYHYINFVYTGLREKYSLIIYDEDGRCYVTECPEEVCRILIDNICQQGISVSAGFSEELFALYSSSPQNFRNAVKNYTMPSPYQMPPNEIK